MKARANNKQQKHPSQWTYPATSGQEHVKGAETERSGPQTSVSGAGAVSGCQKLKLIVSGRSSEQAWSGEPQSREWSGNFAAPML